jgi:hypothetical protein
MTRDGRTVRFHPATGLPQRRMNPLKPLAVAALLASRLACAESYLESSVGLFDSSSRCAKLYTSVTGGPALVSCQHRPMAIAFRVGHRWSSGLGMEAALLQTDDVRGHFDEPNLRVTYEKAYGPGTYLEQFQRQSNQSVALAATYTWDLADRLSAVAKIGWATSMSRSSITIRTDGRIPDVEQTAFTTERTRSRFYSGAELKYRVTDTAFATLSFDLFTLGYDRLYATDRGPSGLAARAKMFTVGVGTAF